MGIEHEVGRRVEAQQRVPAGQTVEVDVGEGDGVTGERIEVAGPVGQVEQLGAQEVLAGLGLLEGRLLQGDGAEMPASGGIARRFAGLHLQHQQPVLGMGDDRVSLAIARRPVGAHGPGPADVDVDAVGRLRQGRPQA